MENDISYVYIDIIENVNAFAISYILKSSKWNHFVNY